MAERGREHGKLVEIINNSGVLCDTCGEDTASYCADAIADALLANGVIVPLVKEGDIAYFPSTCITAEGLFGRYIDFSRVAKVATWVDLIDGRRKPIQDVYSTVEEARQLILNEKGGKIL